MIVARARGTEGLMAMAVMLAPVIGGTCDLPLATRAVAAAGIAFDT